MLVACMIDGGFFQKKVFGIKRPEPVTADDVIQCCKNLFNDEEFQGDTLFRIFYYDCYPAEGSATNPISGKTLDFSDAPVSRYRRNFLDDLKLKPRVALRLGELITTGWKIPQNRTREIIDKIETGQHLQEDDVHLDFTQKQVDIKVGLDIAWLSGKRIVDKIILVTGDSDFIPAMKYARKEGAMVFLAPLGHYPLREGLQEHCDGIIDMVYPG